MGPAQTRCQGKFVILQEIEAQSEREGGRERERERRERERELGLAKYFKDSHLYLTCVDEGGTLRSDSCTPKPPLGSFSPRKQGSSVISCPLNQSTLTSRMARRTLERENGEVGLAEVREKRGNNRMRSRDGIIQEKAYKWL